MTHFELVQYLASTIVALKLGHSRRIGIDGVDAAGKTFLADELARRLELAGQSVIRASIDGFHQPRSVRYQQGHNSPTGYYQDSFNNTAIILSLLEPLGAGGTRQYKTAVFDYKTDHAVTVPSHTAAQDAILIMDGVFLFRPELVNYWDLKIFLDVDFDTSLKRALHRDINQFDSEQDLLERYRLRYIPGQELYINAVNPKAVADIVINNNNFNRPEVIVKS